MKPIYSEEKIVNAVGRLGKDDNGEFIIVIEMKDDTIIKSLDELAEIAEGSMVQFKSVDVEA